MKELMRSNNIVLVSFVKSLLDDAAIPHLVLDTHMSVIEGSLGVLPRRVLVEEARLPTARRVLTDNGLGHEMSASG